ncbi:MAG: hypothetical protein ABEJ70_02840 [Halobacteriaceae archaeon]
MDDAILDEQRDLVARIDEADWDVTDVELSVYASPWEDDAPEATVTITARKPFPEAEVPDAGPDDDEESDSPFRVR